MPYDPETSEFVAAEDGSCHNCELLEARLASATMAMNDLQSELIRVLRREKLLEAKLKRQQTESSEGKAARALFRYWVERLGKNRKTCKFGDKRRDAVVARLRDGYTPAYIARAIDGLAEYSYTNAKGVTFDDLELVCRNEVKLERYYRQAEANDAPTLLSEMWLAEFDHTEVADPWTGQDVEE